MMIKKQRVNSKYIDENGKLKRIMIADEFTRVINIFIEALWAQQLEGNFVEFNKKDIVNGSWLSDRLKRTGYDIALFIVKLQKKKKINCKPVLDKFAMKVCSEFIDIG